MPNNMNEVFKNLKTDANPNEFDKFKLDNKIELYELMFADLKSNNKVKAAYNPMYDNILNTIKKLQKNLKEKDLKITELEQMNRSTLQPMQQSTSRRTYNNYSDAVKNKESKFTMIIRKSENSTINDLKEETIKKLNSVKNQIEVLNVKHREHATIVEMKSDEQLQILKNEVEKDQQMTANQPTERIPTILIKRIDNDLKEEQIVNEISENYKLRKEECVVKKYLNDPNYNTNRMFINLKKEQTIQIIQAGFVKIGYQCYPVEARFNLVQCFCCHRFGHRHKDKDGNIVCRNKASCGHCAGEHMTHQCKSLNDKSKLKCSNCKDRHGAKDGKCKSRQLALNKIKQTSCC